MPPMNGDRSARIEIILGENIRAARELRGLTREQVAARIGVPVIHLARVEAGLALPSVIMFVRVAKALDVDADFLLGYSEQGGPRS